jgi:Zn-dependent peptidase ImmA (M78 family)
MKTTSSMYERIKKIATELLEKYNIACIPISGFEIANKMGIAVIPYPQKKRALFLKISEDGFTYCGNKGVKVYYNPSQMYQRINNTIVHEIGHIVLRHKQPSELAEAEANFFAKYLLALPVLIHKMQMRSIDEIKETFGISHQAAEYALNYYRKWLNNSGQCYKTYEMIQLRLFRHMKGDDLQQNQSYQN